MSELSDLGAKLDRANELLGIVNKEIQAYLGRNPFRIGLSWDDTTGEAVWKFTDVTPPSPKLGIIVGEAVHDIRSPLDHLIYEIVDRAGEVPTINHQFPICQQKPSWPTQRKRCLRKVPKYLVSRIEEEQPYHRVDSQSHPLSVIQILSNTDKHRNINAVTLSTVETADVTFSPDGVVDDVRAIQDGTDIAIGVELVRVRPVSSRPVDLTLESQPKFTVGFGDVRAKITDLRDCSDHVRRIISRFQDVFEI